MKHAIMMMLGPAFVAAMGGVASGAMTTGNPYVLDAMSEVRVEFVSQNAGAKGMLYFLGTENTWGTSYEPSSDAHNLGMSLFSNHGTGAGYGVDLGVFDAGDTIHLAYLITNGVSVLPTGTITRTDVAGDLVYFGMDPSFTRGDGASVTTVRLEDIKNPNHSDWDYNDMVFQIVATPIPAPSAAAIGGIGLAMLATRRRPQKKGS